MKDYISLDTTPSSEPCVSVNPNVDYYEPMKEEAKRYKAMLEDRYYAIQDKLDIYGYFKIQRNEHDFGSYLDVVFVFDDDYDDSQTLAYFIEDSAPEKWDDEPLTVEDFLEFCKSNGYDLPIGMEGE